MAPARDEGEQLGKCCWARKGDLSRLDRIAGHRQKRDGGLKQSTQQLLHLLSRSGAVAAGADGLAMAGGDGSQAVVAAVAAKFDLPYACVPAGTSNHFALDLGVDRDDVVGALDATPTQFSERGIAKRSSEP